MTTDYWLRTTAYGQLTKMLTKYWKAETGIFLGLWLALMFAGRTQLFRDPGTFWHTAVGERMLVNGELVRADPYTYTFRGEPWIAHQWLGETAMAFLYRLGGFDTLLLATVTALAAVYTGLAQRLIRMGLHWSLAVVLLVIVVAASSYHFHVRPHIASMVFMAVFFAVLCDCEAGRKPLHDLILLVPLFALWANTHGGALGGLATLALVVAGWLGLWLIGAESPIHRLKQALLVSSLALACGLAILFNPYGLDLPRVWLSIMGAELPDLIAEHAPLELGSLESWCLLLLASLYAFVLIGTLPRWPRATWLIPLIWFYLACTRIRHGPLLALTAGLAIAEMFPHTRWAAWLVRKGSDWFQPPAMLPAAVSDRRPYLLPVLLVALALVLQMAAVPVPVLGAGWVQLDQSLWPLELAPELRRLDPAANGPLFNEFSFGGFLILFAPNWPVFIDDRCELFLEQGFLRDYAEAQAGNTAVLDRWMERHRFRLALTRPGSPFDEYFRRQKNWLPIGRSPAANLYQQQGAGHNAE